MRVFLLVVATGVAVWAVVGVARAISGARLDHALSAQAPTPEDIAAVMSDARAEALLLWSPLVTRKPITSMRRPGEVRRRTA